MFYQPTDHQPDDLPEVDQKALKKGSGGSFYDKSEDGATPPVHQTRVVIPSYEEATRRNHSVVSNEVVVTPKRDNLVQSNDVITPKNDKAKGRGDDGEKKKSSVWYEYGEV